MITVITDKRQINELHNLFNECLGRFLTEDIDCIVGYPSGSFPDTVKFSQNLNILISLQKLNNRFWNGFGVGRPIEGKNNSLIGEVNFPYEGTNRRISGVFAKENNGRILLLHRGRIGGGKLGIGKQFFTGNFRGDFVTAIEGDRDIEFCLIGEMDSPYFPRQVANFISEIYRVKHLSENEYSSSYDKLNDFIFTDEHSGQTKKGKKEKGVFERTHGIVVNALAVELNKRKYKIGNDKNRDLFIHNNIRINTLFEIKTSSATQNLYTAVGQLVIYSIPIKNDVNLVIVIPDKLNDTVAKRLLQLGIIPLYFNWIDGLPVFIELDELLDRKLKVRPI